MASRILQTLAVTKIKFREEKKMKKIGMLVLAMVLGLSANGVIFAKDGLMMSDRSAAKPGIMMSDRSASKTGLMMSDFAGEEETGCNAEESEDSFAGILLSDFYEFFTGESDTKECE